MKVSITFAAVVALIPSAFAHVVMDFPKPFAGGQDAMSPMDEAGTLFPCMAPNYDSLGSQLTIQPGESGVIELAKSFPGAPHGGGSCQISLTYDKAPTASSRFTVIKSIMGGCPVRTNLNDNTGPYSLSYTIPKDAPSGPAILAWTWFNQIGNREMYMRCSPITIGGSNTDTSSFSKRPEIFKSNIGNGCKTEANKDVIFPNPGPDVEGSGNAAPTGEGCGSSSSAPIEVPAPVTSTLPTSSATPTETGVLAPGGDKIKLPTTTTATSSVQSPVQTPIETPETPIETPETPVEAPVETPAPTPIETPVEDEEPVVSKPVSPPVAAPETPVVSAPSKDAVPCSKPGAVVCTSDNTFALCNHGFLVPMGRTALGTFCANGVISRRSYPIRLTGHLRRRHGKF